MPLARAERNGDTNQYSLAGRPLSNDDEVELRLGGNRGWVTVTVTGLPDALRASWTADDGQTLTTTVPPEAQLRWP